MRGCIIQVITTSAILALTGGCLDPFDPPASQQALRGLVVEGFVNGTDHNCSIALRRTVPLAYGKPPPLEHGASLTLEFENGQAIPLSEPTPGIYSASDIDLPASIKVKLRIATVDGNVYESDPVLVLDSPAIDSVTYGATRTGVPIYVSSHDPSGKSNYYYWRFEETWRYTSAFPTSFGLDEDKDGNAIIVPLKEPYYYCWKTEYSTEILVASASPADRDVNKITEQILLTIPWTSPKFVDRYSILVEQYSISKEAFEYFLELKRNTENLGTLFDPLPSRPSGNIRCLTNPDLPVLGFFRGSTVQTKRIYIDYFDVDRPIGIRPVTGYENCRLVDLVDIDQLSYLLPADGRGAEPYCVDCRIKGGTNKVPSFWTFTDPEN